MSSAPTPYNPAYDFQDYQAANPNDPLPGDKVDIELAAIETALDTTQARLAEIQNEDGSLKNLSVGAEQLKAGLTVGLSAASSWVTATAYAVNDAVWNGRKLYVCLVAHTSGTFATDLSGAKWLLLLDLDTYLTTAETAATNAAASAAAAATAETNAETAEANAEAAEANFRSKYQVSASAPSLRYDGSALQEGDVYSNTTDKTIYIRFNSAWEPMGQAVAGTFERTEAVGDNVTTTFAVTYDVGYLLVYLDGVLQDPDDYTATNGTSVVFGVAPGAAVKIDFIAMGTFSAANVLAGSIDTAQLADGAVTKAKFEWDDKFYVGTSFTGSPTPAVPAYTDGMPVMIHQLTLEATTSTTLTSGSLTSSGNTATVATATTYSVGDVVVVAGATQTEYNGFYIVDSVNAGVSFTYKFRGSATSPATGTISIRRAAIGDGYTGGKSINLSGLGAKSLRRIGGRKLIPGDTYGPNWCVYSDALGYFLLANPQRQNHVVGIDTSTSVNAFTVTMYGTLPNENYPYVLAARTILASTSTAPKLTLSDGTSNTSARTIYKHGRQALVSGDIAAGRWNLFMWDGLAWELLTPSNDLINRPQTAILEDRDTAGIVNTSATTGSFQTLSLDTEVSDANSIVSISSNRFTPIAGTYLIKASHPFHDTEDTVLRIRNITAGSTTIEGQNFYIINGGYATVEGVLTANGTDAYEVQYRCGGGRVKRVAAAYGTNNVFTRVILQKIG